MGATQTKEPSVPARQKTKEKDPNDKLDRILKQSNQMAESLSKFETRLRALESSAKTRQVAWVPGLKEEDDAKSPDKRFSIIRACYAIANKDWSNAGYEREVLTEAKKARQKVLGSDQGSTGGFLVPPELTTDIIELLRAQLVVEQLGATMMTGLTRWPLLLPKHTGGATAFWIGENEEITASDLSFGQLIATPHKVAALTKLPMELAIASEPAVEGVIREDFARTLALEVDSVALTGDGFGAKPLGIKNQPDVNTDTSFGGGISISDLLDFIGDVEDNNAHIGALGFAVHPAIMRQLKRHTLGTGAPYTYAPPIINDDAIEQATGYRWRKTTQLNAGASGQTGEIIFGNWNDLLVMEWGGLEIKGSDTAGDSSGGAFTSDQLWLRAIMRVDIQVRHGESFSYDNTIDSRSSADQND